MHTGSAVRRMRVTQFLPTVDVNRRLNATLSDLHVPINRARSTVLVLAPASTSLPAPTIWKLALQPATTATAGAPGNAKRQSGIDSARSVRLRSQPCASPSSVAAGHALTPTHTVPKHAAH